jgi:hypothetical protein
LVAPIFRIVESDLDHLGADLVHPVADLELGLPEELVVGLRGEQLGQPAQLVLDGGAEDLEEALGFGGLFRREEGDVHGVSP